jgi:hypothetical protein
MSSTIDGFTPRFGFVFSRGRTCDLLSGMSYLFVAYLWEKKRFARQVLVDAWEEAEPRFPGEQLVHVNVNDRVEAAFYFPGNFSTKSEAFSYGCEVMLMDGWAEAPADERQEVEDFDFRYLVWMSSDMSEYDVVLRYQGTTFGGRAIIDGQGERVTVDEGAVKDYALADISVDPAEFGADGDKDENFDEPAYHRAVEDRAKPFSPRKIIQEVLKVGRQDVIRALHQAWDDKGTVLWPKGGALDTPEMRKEMESAESFLPGLPLWSEWGDQYVPPEKPAAKKTPGPRKTNKKSSAG